MAIMTKDDGGAKVAQRSNVPQCNASALDPMQHKLVHSDTKCPRLGPAECIFRSRVMVKSQLTPDLQSPL